MIFAKARSRRDERAIFAQLKPNRDKSCARGNSNLSQKGSYGLPDRYCPGHPGRGMP
jgi:hypothetical protein